MTRRQFLAGVSMVLGGAGAVAVAVPFIGMLTARQPRTEEVWRDVGSVDHFSVGITEQVELVDPAPLPWAGFSAATSAFLRRESGNDFRAFSVYCTHVGCPVRWEAGAELFMCPCHAGVFYSDGRVAGGPPPRPLDQYPVRVRGGHVEIRTSPYPVPP
ncbi:MAG: Rieske (2Fe-2S) protein [Dehalococcoidia bacterium]